MDDGAKLLLSQRAKNVVDPIAQAEWGQKKLVWVPNKEKGFVSASIVEEKGEKTTVRIVETNSELTLNNDDVQRMNPPKFDKVEDMAELACLNEPSVLYNLSQRYFSNMIYTYSSLFCCVINPYQRLPIYSENVMQLYRGRKRHELPPHVYAIADTAYHSMLYDRENQSILCTGESGAGKTENTKRVIQYLVYVGCKNAGGSVASDLSNKLEQQLLKANPILEAFGNAKTIKNDNSSRFGKFIQINFDNSGFISSTNIITYILEKNRVSHQHKNERSFHIFYQLFKGADQKFKDDIFYNDISKFRFLTNGLVDVQSINDAQEYKDLLTSMQLMEISKEEIDSLFRILSGILHHGNLEFNQDRNSDQASMKGDEVLNKIAKLFKINPTRYSQAILTPKVEVGKGCTIKSQNKTQAEFSVESVAKATYERIFKFVAAKINKCLEKDRRSSFSFIGILDIAGFEIFEINSFEQLCINYTNEKLQQLFNHTMFILEQEEYKREGIDWTFIDFGLDLQPCIDLLEKPLGIFALLDEECWFPKATDISYVDKLVSNHESNPKFIKRDFEKDSKFTVVHYAGKVSYSCIGWLSKNMDPLNDNIIKVLSESSDSLLSDLWKNVDNVVGLKISQPGESAFGPSKTKRGMFRTVGQLYKEQLTNLMRTLKSTNSNFVRCIIPNYEKKPSKIDPNLVLDQLRCNGVLEGIRICRQGYPNRVIFHDFKTRYVILTPKLIPPNFMDSRKACEMMLEKMEMDKANYRIGQSKVFFKSGVLANLEEQRDKILHKYMITFQALLRGKLGRLAHMRRAQKKPAVTIIQRNIRSWLALKEWPWWKLFTRLKPLLSLTRQENEVKQKEEELKRTKEKMDKAEQEVKDLESRVAQLHDERSQFLSKIQTDTDNIQDLEEKYNTLAHKKRELEELVSDLEGQLNEEEQRYRAAKDEIKKIEASLRELGESKSALEAENQKYQLEKVQTDAKIVSLEQDLATTNDSVAKLSKDKKVLEDRMTETSNKLAAEEDKVKMLSKLKSKTEGNLQELLDRIEQLEKIKSDLEKEKSKLEQIVNSLRGQVVEFEQTISNLNGQLSKKDSEIISLNNKIEEETIKRSDVERALRELTSTHEEIKEDLEITTTAKNKAEKQSKELALELDNLRTEWTQTLDTTAIQKDVNTKREKELQNLKQTIQDESERHEKLLAETKSKHNAIVQELNDQLDNFKKTKASLEKTKQQAESEKSDLEEQLARLNIYKTDTDKKVKTLESNLAELNAKFKTSEEEKSQSVIAYNKLKKEYDVLVANFEQLENKSSTNDSELSQLKTQISDLNEEINELTSAKNNLNAKVSELQRKLQSEQEKLEEENNNSEVAKNKFIEIQKSYDNIKVQLESATAEIENAEAAKRHIQKDLEASTLKLQDIEGKYAKLEKSRKKLQEEKDDLALALEKERQISSALDKKQKKFDQSLAEEKNNSEKMRVEKESFERNLRQSEAKIMTLNNQIEEMERQLAAADQAKKTAQNELSGLLENKDDQGKSLHELQKQKNLLESQLEELKAEVEELSDELKMSEDAKTRAEVNLQAVKTSLENEINLREETLEDTKRALTKQLRDMENELEEERKSKGSASSAKKRLEFDLKTLQESLDNANKAKEESLKQIKKITGQMKEFQREIEETRSSKEELASVCRQNESKAKLLESEIARLREEFGVLDRQKRTIENERDEIQGELDQLKLNQINPEEYRRMEAKIAELDEDLEDERAEKESINDRFRKAQSQADRLNSELANERNTTQTLESSKSSLEKQNRDLKVIIKDLEDKVKALSKNTILESRLSSLQDQYDSLLSEKSSLQKAVRKAENKARDFESQCISVRSELEGTKESLARSNQRGKQLRDEISNLESNITALNSAKYKIQSEKDDQYTLIDELQAKINKLTAATKVASNSRLAARNETDES